jgi:hypothetical protein
MTMPKVHLPTFVTLLVLVVVILAVYHFAHKH